MRNAQLLDDKVVVGSLGVDDGGREFYFLLSLCAASLFIRLMTDR